MVEDTALLDRLRRGDATALEALYDRHGSALLALGARIMRDVNRAEEVLHDVFLEAWQQADSFDASRGSVRAWLFVRMRSRCLDRVRMRGRRCRILDDGAANAPTPVPNPQPDEGADRPILEIALDTLPLAQRQVVEALYMRGLTCAETAALLDCPVGTIKSRARLGLKALRRSLVVGGSA